MSYTIHPPTLDTLPSFSRLTRTLLPINYPPKFFEASLQPPSASNAYSLARIAIWNDNDNNDNKLASESQGQVIAGIYGRIQPKLFEPAAPPSNQVTATAGSLSGVSTSTTTPFVTLPPPPPECQLYIATLAVLAPWRGRGVAAALLKGIVAAAVEVVRERMLVKGEGVWMWGPLTTVCAHVWEVNDDGLAWYCGQGFEAGEVITGYYRKLRPDGARFVRRGVVGLLVEREDGKEEEVED